MTIRNRVTLWYAAVLVISSALLAGGMLYEFVYEQRQETAKRGSKEPMEEEVGEVLLIYVLPAFIVTIAGGWWLLRRSLKPLNDLTLAAERINAENLREALPRTLNGDEVDRLSEVLNAMNQRLSSAMQEIHEFTLHASHELKTPLTILHSEIETALQRPDLPREERDRLESQLDEIQRLSRIVEVLALLAKSNSGQLKFQEEPVAIHDIVRDIAEDTVALAQPNRITVEVREIDECWILGDRHRLRQMLLNIADNASKYNKPEGAISISLRAAEASVTMEVANTGDGIPAEDIPNVFKKFYRRSHNSAVSGLGLGLSIVQSIVNAHHGTISISSRPPDWTMFQITFPRIPAPTSDLKARATAPSPMGSFVSVAAKN